MAKKVDGERFRVDTADPVSRFVIDRLGLDWHAVFLIAIIVYGPIEKILIPYVGGYLRLEFTLPMQTWIPDIEALLTGFVVFPFFFAYYIWSGRGLGLVFMRLARAEIFSDREQFQRFWTRAQRCFNHRRWWIVAVGVAVGAMAFWQFVVWKPEAAVAPWFDLWYDPTFGRFAYEYGRQPFARALSILLIGFVAYAFVQVVIREALALYWLTRLWDDMEENIVVHPYHHDEAGGLGGVGRHALQLSAFVGFVLVFIVMGSFLPALRVPLVNVTIAGLPRVLDGSLVGFWILYFIFLGWAIRPLLLRPHELMCRARDRRVDVVSKELNELIERQQQAVSEGRDDLESISKRIDELKKVRAQIIEDAQVWPFTMELRIQLGLTSLPALLLPAAKLGLQEGFDQLVSVFTKS
jgi:hypothetical protein